MMTMAQAEGGTVAWPLDKVIFAKKARHTVIDGDSTENKAHVHCRLFNWSGESEIVAEGRWISSDPKMLVNGIPLGPNAMVVLVDVPVKPDEFLWRPSIDMMFIADAVDKKIAWPAENVVLDKTADSDQFTPSPVSVNKSNSVNTGNSVNKKCKLMDCSGSKVVVAEGRWASSDPNQMVHFVPLGPGAVKVWVDIPKVPHASLWRPNSECQCIEDAVGSPVAWPAVHVVYI